MNITIYADYVCPYCLLVEHIIQQVMEGQDLVIQWRPFELRPDPIPTLRVEDPYLHRVWKQSVYPLAERLGVHIKLPDISPQPRTTKAFEVFAMADEQGLGHAFSMRTLEAFFQEGKDIGNPEIITQLGEDVGLDRQSVKQALNMGSYRQHHQEALRYAREDMRISSVPTLLVGQRVLHGVVSADELRSVINQVNNNANLQNIPTQQNL